jgi:uncharacterized damage-inducible protein DinB
MGRIRWVDRRFDFSFPVEVYPELIERLRGTPARVADRLDPIDPQRRVRRNGRAWSIQEHAGHLADLDVSLFLPRLEEYEVGVATLRPADWTNRGTEAAEHNRRSLDEVVAALRASRDAVVHRLETLDPGSFAREALHPRLRCPMRLVDMLFFHAEHDDYHLASITELLRNGGSPWAGR